MNSIEAPATGDLLARSRTAGFVAGAAVGLLGGPVGLGGAEFRLPMLLGMFGFTALAAVIVNKTRSLVVVTAALPARLAAVPLADIVDEWTAVVSLLAGSLVGAWMGATWTTRTARPRAWLPGQHLVPDQGFLVGRIARHRSKGAAGALRCCSRR